jgi:hypothetical protein
MQIKRMPCEPLHAASDNNSYVVVSIQLSRTYRAHKTAQIRTNSTMQAQVETPLATSALMMYAGYEGEAQCSI